MFLRRRRRFSARSEWFGAINVTPASVGVNSTSYNVLLSQAQMEELPGAKLAIIRGSLFVSPATAPAAATGYGVFLGIYRRTSISGTNITPDPEINPEFGWIWWDLVFPQIGGTAAADSNASRWIGYFRLDIALRTRIRWHEFDDVLLAVKNSASSGAAIQFSYGFRLRVVAGRK